MRQLYWWRCLSCWDRSSEISVMLINQYSAAKTTTSSWPIHHTHTALLTHTHLSSLCAFWLLSFPMYCLPSFSLFPQSVSEPTSVSLQHISSLAHHSSSLHPSALFPQHPVLSVCVSASSAVHLSASLWSISVSFASGWLARQQALGPPLTYTSPEPVEKVFLDLIKLLDRLTDASGNKRQPSQYRPS